VDIEEMEAIGLVNMRIKHMEKNCDARSSNGGFHHISIKWCLIQVNERQLVRRHPNPRVHNNLL